VRLVVGMSEKSGTTDKAGGSGTIVYFRVHDIAVTHQALAARKVTFVAAPHMVAKFPDHELWLAFFIDPDENVLALMSEVRPAKAD
jgi:methylmalonyl-CoA/ethylmalonyl-CoA epimerase